MLNNNNMKRISVEEVFNKLTITPTEFINLYINDDWSLVDFKENYNLSYRITQRILDHYNIKRRGLKQSQSLSRRQTKYKNSIQEKYGDGICNPSQSKEVKDKKKNTFFRNYGVDNVWKSKTYYEWLDSYMIETYGKKRITGENQSEIRINYWKNLPTDIKEERIKSMLVKLHGTGPTSKLETLVAVSLEEMDIHYDRSFWIKNRQYDFKIKDTNILIEVQGDFWHGNPLKYKSGDILKIPGTDGILVDKIWKKDKNKLDLANTHGYNIIYVWECDIRKCKHVEILFNEIKKYKKD